MSEAAVAEATLELTVVYPDTLKSKLKLVAWVDKRSPKTLTLTLTLDTPATLLHLPLASHLLRNPSSSLTVQILSPRRLPFRPSLLLASASLPLSSLPLLAADALALPLPLSLHHRRRRGGACVVRVAVRVLWPLGAAPDDRSAEPVRGAAEFVAAEPSAPPLPTAPPPPPPPQGTAEDGAWRSFVVGLASGAVAAAAVVGVLGLSEI